MAAKRPETIQAQILAQLAEVMGKVEESLEQGRENGNELKMLRKELGLDGPHGRLPIVEATLIRHETRFEKTETRLEKIELAESESNGKAKLIATAFALIGGGAGGALIAIIAHILGLR